MNFLHLSFCVFISVVARDFHEQESTSDRPVHLTTVSGLQHSPLSGLETFERMQSITELLDKISVNSRSTTTDFDFVNKFPNKGDRQIEDRIAKVFLATSANGSNSNMSKDASSNFTATFRESFHLKNGLPDKENGLVEGERIEDFLAINADNFNSNTSENDNGNFSVTLNGLNVSEMRSDLNNSCNNSVCRLKSNETEGLSNPIWRQGLIGHKSFVRIMKNFRWSMILPGSLSICSAGLIVLVVGRKSFRLAGKKLAIAFNVTEGIKCLVFILNRSWKAYIIEEPLTFRSSYSMFFVSVIMWLPDTLARGGILLNCCITIERFFMLAYPVRFHKTRLILHDNILILTIAAAMLLFQTNPIILFYIHAKPFLNHSQTFVSDDLVSMIAKANPLGFNLYISLQVGGAVMFRAIPILLTIIFNTMTVVSLCRYSKQRQTLVASTGRIPSRKSTSFQTNRMLLVSSCLFAFMASLKPVNRALRLVVPTYGEGEQNSFIYIILNDAFLLVDNMVPLVNIIVYSKFSSQFSRRLWAWYPYSKEQVQSA